MARATGNGADLRSAFERAPRLVERLAPLVSSADDPRRIVDKARRVLDAMSEPERIAVLDAHPRLGAAPAGLSTLSRQEQGDAGGATARYLAALNETYESRFGFRFVTFVDRRSFAEIAPELRRRLYRSRNEELATGLEQFLAIALDRMERAR